MAFRVIEMTICFDDVIGPATDDACLQGALHVSCAEAPAADHPAVMSPSLAVITV